MKKKTFLRRENENVCGYSLLVGAPRDHSPHDIISKRGAVWKCEFQADQICQRIPFRRDGEATVRVGTSFDNKTDQWLGASLAANDGNILVINHFNLIIVLNRFLFSL